jgi:hypothetical protein
MRRITKLQIPLLWEANPHIIIKKPPKKTDFQGYFPKKKMLYAKVILE